LAEYIRTTQDNLTISDTLSKIAEYYETALDSLTINEIISFVAQYSKDLADNHNFSESVSLSGTSTIIPASRLIFTLKQLNKLINLRATSNDSLSLKQKSNQLNLQIIDNNIEIKNTGYDKGFIPSDLDGCVGWWKMNEFIGSTTINQINGISSVISGGTFATGKYGNCLDFNGTNSQVYIANGSLLNAGSTNALTLSIWVNRASTAGGASTYTGLIGRDGNYSKWGLIQENSFVINFSVTNMPNTRVGLTTSTTIPAGSWTHVAGTYDGSTGSMIIYFNGSNVKERLNTGSLYDEMKTIRIAGNSTNLSFKGKLDEALIYNRALTPSEIGSLYLNTKPSLNSLIIKEV
jgi:hypothetical protein